MKRFIQKLFSSNSKNAHAFRHWGGSFVLMLALSLAVHFSGYSHLITAGILPNKVHAPFDGLTLPIKVMPQWHLFTEGDRSAMYNNISSSKFVPFPKYEASNFLHNFKSLQPEDPMRNFRLTVPVPYMGSYSNILSNTENSGSHPAVDIKLPQGTPVFAIGNGIIDKVAHLTTGFGKNVVIRHDNFPTLDDTSQTNTIYSSYSHLDTILVNVGDVIRKGDQIGTVGDTGLSTTNHLHFQIDNDSAPWHPFWPFTFQDARNAGVSFWEGVNIGLGREKGLATTINPLVYVEKYRDDSQRATSNEQPATPEPTPEPTAVSTPTPAATSTPTSTPEVTPEPTPEPTPTPVPTPTPTPVTIIDTTIDRIEIEYDTFTLKNTNVIGYLTAYDESGKVVRDVSLKDEIKLTVNDGSIASLARKTISSSDFKHGSAPFVIIPVRDGDVRVSAVYLAKRTTGPKLAINSEFKQARRYHIKHDGQFNVNEPETITVRWVDENGKQTPVGPLTGSLRLTLGSGEGYFDRKSVPLADFQEGITTVTLTPTSKENINIIAQGGLLYGESTTLQFSPPAIFHDITSTHENYTAINFLKERKIVQGYDDGTFKPDNSISRAEVLKLLYEGLDLEVASAPVSSFSDVDVKEWYALYVFAANADGIVTGYSDGTFKPGQEINKVEFLKVLLSMLDITPDTYTGSQAPYSDVPLGEWYTDIVAYAKEKNLFTLKNPSVFSPENSINRAEAAEVLYRLLKILGEKLDRFEG